MLITLAFFIVGSVAGAAHVQWWGALPALQPLSLVKEWGLAWALGAQLAALALIALATVYLEKKRHGDLGPAGLPPSRGWRRFVQGRWPLAWGAAGLALFNLVTLYLAGRPWGVTSAFVLWGSKIGAAVGVDVYSWPYWAASRSNALRASVFADINSVMNFGIILGALLGAGLAGRFAPVWRLSSRSIVSAALGGLLLGYGARLAYGCNIGALLAGISSSSVHGWLWFASALAGTVAGVRLRSVFEAEGRG